MDWQPIETAPKDGGEFLAYSPGGLLIWEMPDISGFMSGCDMGPDVIEQKMDPQIDIFVFMGGRFLNSCGQEFEESGVHTLMDCGDCETSEGHEIYRITHWKPLPEPPK